MNTRYIIKMLLTTLVQLRFNVRHLDLPVAGVISEDLVQPDMVECNIFRAETKTRFAKAIVMFL